MTKVCCLNPIARIGTKNFTKEYELTENFQEADAVLVRSANMHEVEFPESLTAIARA
mgnify:FL=1